MIKIIITLSLLFVMAAPDTFAKQLMSKAQYEDYSVLFHCSEMKIHDNLKVKNEEQARHDKAFGLDDDSVDAFEKMIVEYEVDDKLLDRIRDRANKECDSHLPHNT